MEESIKTEAIYDYLYSQFELKEVDPKTYSPLILAYIGDSVYDLVIKTIIVSDGNTQVNKLHQRAASLVKAHSQSEMISQIEEALTEEEQAVYRRGRNAKSHTMAKNATMGDYRRATGFEALIGYLYLKKQFKRIIDLIKLGLADEKGNTK